MATKQEEPARQKLGPDTETRYVPLLNGGWIDKTEVVAVTVHSGYDMSNIYIEIIFRSGAKREINTKDAAYANRIVKGLSHVEDDPGIVAPQICCTYCAKKIQDGEIKDGLGQYYCNTECLFAFGGPNSRHLGYK